MLLESRTAVVYGAGGSIGGAAATAFAREGAIVHLVGHHDTPLQKVADEIERAGGRAEIAVFDALDELAIDEHADSVARAAGAIDISLNVIGHGDVHGTPLAQMTLADFERPIHGSIRTTFLTARAAARHMIPSRSGVILMFGGDGDPMRDYFIGGTQVAFSAVEMLRRQLAAELGPHGIRVVTLRTGGIPESLPTGMEGRAAIVDPMVAATMLGRAATLADVGNVFAFAASDQARTLTGTAINISCGAIVD